MTLLEREETKKEHVYTPEDYKTDQHAAKSDYEKLMGDLESEFFGVTALSKNEDWSRISKTHIDQLNEIMKSTGEISFKGIRRQRGQSKTHPNLEKNQWKKIISYILHEIYIQKEIKKSDHIIL